MAFVLIVAVCSIFIGLSKGGLGAALVMLATPLLSLVMPVTDAISIVLPMLLIADVFGIWAFWNTWDMAIIRLLLPFTVIGIIVGTYLLATLPDQTLRHILGVFTLGFVAYRLLSARLGSRSYTHHNWHGHLAGAASGLGSALANVGAPPFTVYMLLQNRTPRVFVGTTTLYFAIVNLLKLPGLVVAGLFDLRDLETVVWALPLIPAGVWLGRWVIVRMNQTAFDRFMLLVLAVAGVFLLVLPAG